MQKENKKKNFDKKLQNSKNYDLYGLQKGNH